MRRSAFLLVALAALLAFGVSCSSPQAEPTPVRRTKTPKPTFTPTVAATELPIVLPTATPEPGAQPAAASTDAQGKPASAPAPTAAPASPTPAPAAHLSANQNVNVRGGPGTSYAVIGRLAAGEGGDITGQNADGSWYQFAFSGQSGWVTRDLVTTSGDVASVKVPQNIPTAPPPPPTAVPQKAQPTAAPAQAQPTAAPAVPQKEFIHVDGSDRPAPNGAGPFFEGKTQYKSGGAWNWVCIMMDHYGNRVVKASGAGGKGDGNWGHSPGCNGRAQCALGDFIFYVVECPKNLDQNGQLTLQPGQAAPALKSDGWKITVTDLNTTGQWYNIIFRSTQQ